MRIPTVILSLAALLAISPAAPGAADNVTSALTPPQSYETVVVAPRTVELMTNAVGSLVPKNRTVLPAPVSGKVEWVIDEGKAVTKGTEVARLDCTEHQDNLEQNQLDFAVAEAELRRAKLEEQLVREQLEFDVKRCRLELERSRLRRSTLGPPVQSDVELSRLAVEQTRFAMEAAAKEHARLKVLGEKGIESGRTIATARLKFERAQADHLKARTDFELLMKGTPAEDVAVADQEVKRAETALDLAQKRLTSQAAWQATQVRVAEAALERVRTLMEYQQGRIDSSRVTASADGVVLYPRYWGVALRAGDLVWRSNRLLDIADLSDMTVEAVISQVDWPRVQPGQKASIRLTAFPDKVFHGVVKKVGKLARDRSLILAEDVANVMSFQVVVDVEGRSPELRPSYSAQVAIVTDRLEGCIAVPRGALVRRGEGAAQDFVWVKEGDEVRPRLVGVTLGPSDATLTVVEKGLRVGDSVLVPLKRQP